MIVEGYLYIQDFLAGALGLVYWIQVISRHYKEGQERLREEGWIGG